MTFEQNKEFDSQEASICFVQVSDTMGQYSKLPENAMAVSRYYHISSSKSLNTAVTLKIFYRTAEKNTGQLHFVTSTDISPPYRYQVLHGGYFTSTYGEITVETFSFYTICRLFVHYGMMGISSYIETRFKASLYRSNQPTPRNRWNIYLVVVKNCDIFSRMVKRYIQEYYSESVTLVREQIIFLSDNTDHVTVHHNLDTNSPRNISVNEPDHCILNHSDISDYVDGLPPLLKYNIGCKFNCSFKLRFTLDGFQKPTHFTLRESDMQGILMHHTNYKGILYKGFYGYSLAQAYINTIKCHIHSSTVLRHCNTISHL